MYLYHFLSCGVIKENNLDQHEHFNKVKESGVLIPKVDRGEYRSWNTKNDPEEDKRYVFLTANEGLFEQMLNCINDARLLHKINTRKYGFIFNAEDLRYDPDTFFREFDIVNPYMAGRTTPEEWTHPFTDQQLTSKSEILYYGWLDLDLACSEIINGEVILKEKENEVPLWKNSGIHQVYP